MENLTEEQKNELWRTYRSKIEELRKKHNRTDGVVLNDYLGQLQTSYEIYYENFKDLHNLLEDYHKTEFNIKLWEWKKDEQVRAYLRKVLRSLHNYIASASTLTDHARATTRKVCKLFNAVEFKSCYDSKIKELFAEDPRSDFMRRFRNYCLHARLAPIRASIEMKSSERNVNLFLRKERLEDREEWTPLSKKYITSMKDEEPLFPIVYEYSKVLHGFYGWYEKEYAKAFSIQFEETNKLRLEMNAKIKEMNERVGLPTDPD